MFDATIFKQNTFAGKSFIQQNTISVQGVDGAEDSIPAAKAGTLTTRTDANTGTLTMDTGHGITTGAKIDLYWDGGSRRNVTVGTVATNSVPIDLGSGDDLPIATTVIQAAVRQVFTVSLDGDSVELLLAACDGGSKCTIVLYSGVTTEELAIVLPANEIYEWLGSGTNPIAGDAIDTIAMTHADTAAAHNMRVAAGLDL